LDTISEQEKFYGYIIGLQVERCPTDRVGDKLYATFEYNGQATVWRVPDPALFKILSSYLCSMAEFRVAGEDYGYSKLWIKKDKGKWDVRLP
jgi:hypothetical protein